MILALGRQKQRWVPGLHSKTVSNSNQQREERKKGRGEVSLTQTGIIQDPACSAHTVVWELCDSILGFWTLKQVTASNLISLADSPVLPRRMVVRK